MWRQQPQGAEGGEPGSEEGRRGQQHSLPALQGWALILSGGAAPHGIRSLVQGLSSAIHCPGEEYHKGHSTLGDACFRSRIQSLHDW